MRKDTLWKMVEDNLPSYDMSAPKSATEKIMGEVRGLRVMRKEAGNRRSFYYSVGIHAMLLLLLFNLALMKSSEIVAPTYVVKIVSPTLQKMERREQQLIKDTERLPMGESGTQGLS